GNDLLFERARNLVAAAIRLHPMPEMQMVVVLAGIVEEAGILAERALHDVFERLVFPFRAGKQLVAVVDIGLVMLVVMIFERLARHVGGEGIVGIGEVGQRKGHGNVLASLVTDYPVTCCPVTMLTRKRRRAPPRPASS